MQDGYLIAVGITTGLILFLTAAIHIYKYASHTPALRAQTRSVGSSIGHGHPCAHVAVIIGWQTLELSGVVGRVAVP